MSDLGEHLTKHGIRQADFAERIGSTQSMVSRLIKGSVLPGLELAVKIERATGGDVTASSWIRDAEPTPTPEEDAA